MRGRVDLLQLPDAYLRVDLRGADVRMSEHRLDEPYIRSVLQHQGRHRVSEQMTASRFPDVGTVHVIAHQLTHTISSERQAVVGQEQRGVVFGHGKLWPSFIAVFEYPA